MPPVDLGGARPGMLVSDVVFNPPETPLPRRRPQPRLTHARWTVHAGPSGRNRVPVWTGREAPEGVMKQALAHALGVA